MATREMVCISVAGCQFAQEKLQSWPHVGQNGLRIKSHPKSLPKSKGDSSGSKAKGAKAKEERTNPTRKDP